MRSWQYMGFNPAACAILNEKVKIGIKVVVELNMEGHPVQTYTQDRMIEAYVKEEYDKIDVWYGNMKYLYRYTFNDGRVLEDYVQAEPWSSGPCTFMALRDANTKEPLPETLWSEDTIAKA